MAKRRPPPDLPPEDDDPRVRFPFGETWDDDSDESFAASSDERLGRSSGTSLPALPPGSRLEDDASLDGLGLSSDEAVVDLDDSDALAAVGTDLGAIDSDLGPISASGPLVIVGEDEDEDEASSRFQASILDDSARLAGAESRRRRPKRPAKRSARRSWREEPIDPDAEVPTLSTRAPAQRSPSRLPVLLAAAAGLLVAAGVGALLEQRRRAALDAQAQAQAQEVARLEAERDAARTDEQRAREAAASAEAAAGEARRQGHAAAERARREALEEARREAEAAGRAAVAAARAEAHEAAEAAFEVELARARRAAQAEAEARAEEERAGARAQVEAAIREASGEAARRVAELERQRRELEARLTAATTRAEEEALARRLAEERARALDAVEPAGGGSASEGVDDWDAMFDDAFAEAAPGEAGATPAAGEGETLHPVDRAWRWLRQNVHGSIGYKNLTHFSAGFDRDQRQTRHELRVELEYRDWLVRDEAGTKGLRAVAGVDVRVDDAEYAAGVLQSVDDDERRRPIVVPDEAYLALTLDWFEARGGYQVFAWGSGDLFNPTDNLNPIDFSDLFDSRRIPVFAASITIDRGAWALELVSIPTFTRSRLPLQGERFDLLAGAPVPVLRPADPELTADNAQWAARAIARVGGVDMSLSGFTGWNDIPAPRLGILAGTGQPVIDPVFERIHVLGADFATTLGIFGAEGRLGEVLGGVQLHGEAAHTWTEDEEGADYLQYVIGFNYMFVDLIAEHDLSIGLEYAGDVETRSPAGDLASVPRVDRALKGAVLARLEYKIERQYLDLALELTAALITHGPENALLHPAAKWRVTDALHLELGGDVFLGPDDTFFGRFRNDGRVTFLAKLTF